MKTTSRIEDHNIVSILACMLYGSFCNVDRILIFTHGENRYSLLISIDL